MTRVRTVDSTAEFVAVDGTGAAMIHDVTHDSRQADTGTLFAAVPGAVHDGHDHVHAAVEGGAVALLVEKPVDVSVPQIRTRSVRGVMGPVAALVHGDPSHRLRVIGVTGTNGKTTTTWLLQSILRTADRRSEMIGTITGARTTPEATDLQRQLGDWADAGVEFVAMEVSSHALALHRVDGCRFSVGAFTNLSPDHLDFHRTMDDYGAAKARLFEPGRAEVAVIDVDDPFGRELADRCGSSAVRVSLSDAVDVVADPSGTSFTWRGHSLRVRLPGRFNVSNALLAATIADHLGIAPADIVAGIDSVSAVPGRMETVEGGQRFGVVVDYAHTPDAVRSVLSSLRAVLPPQGRLIAVLGCGGDRDATKRPLMGAELARGSDVAVITSDNPRSEDPAAIIADVLTGVPGWQDRDDLIVEADRAAAIAAAIGIARENDIVLIAGKGHETYQEIGGERHDFDDREVARSLLSTRAGETE